MPGIELPSRVHPTYWEQQSYYNPCFTDDGFYCCSDRLSNLSKDTKLTRKGVRSEPKLSSARIYACSYYRVLLTILAFHPNTGAVSANMAELSRTRPRTHPVIKMGKKRQEWHA